MARILVAEDEKSIRFLLTTILQKQGYQLTVVENGQQALDALDSSYNLLITDVKMPVMDGIQLVIAARERGYLFPIIVTSAYPTEAIEALEFGAQTFLTKPFTHQALVQAVRGCLNGNA